MRELARCIAWSLALGAAALLLAVFTGVGLAQADGVWAWAVLLVYSPYYLLGQFVDNGPPSPMLSAFDAAVFGAQFLYFFLLTTGVRYLHRKRPRQ